MNPTETLDTAKSMAHTYKVEGIHCASCAAVIKRTLSKVDGVQDVRVNYATEEAVIEHDMARAPLETMNIILQPLGYVLKPIEDTSQGDVSPMHHELSDTDDKNAALFTFPIALFIFALMLYEIAANQVASLPPIPIPMRVFTFIQWVLASIILFGFGQRFLTALFRFFRYGSANMDTLVGLGTGAAYIYSSILYFFPVFVSRYGFIQQQFFDVTIVVIGFIILGKYLESTSKRKTGEALQKLIGLQVKTAILIRDNKQTEVPVDQVIVGDIVLVKPGMKIPIDGKIVDGSSAIDEALVTGESMPVDKTVGDTVIGSTMNIEGVITIRATRVGKDTLLSHIIDQVRLAQGSKAPIERFVDTVSSIFVPTVLVLSILSFIGWLLFGRSVFPSAQVFSMALQSAIGVLIIACPCALGLATPTAVIVAVGRGARMGILVKDAESLELLGRINAIILDKTGTLTEGKPHVVSVKTAKNDATGKTSMQILASLEQFSEHPLAKAIMMRATNMHTSLLSVKDFRAIPGMGVQGIIGKHTYYAGNLTFMKDHGIDGTGLPIESSDEGYTKIYVGSKNLLLGIALVADQPKAHAIEAIRDIKRLGIHIVMATGDTASAARMIGNALGIEDIRAELTPSGKTTIIEELKKDGYKVAMVGDGVNDAPALATADVGIAMSTGTDVAMSTANITLLHGDITKVAQVVRLSKQTMRIVKQNLFWAFIYNIIGIPIAAGALYPLFGITLNPVFAGAAMALSSISVVTNSLRLQRVRVS